MKTKNLLLLISLSFFALTCKESQQSQSGEPITPQAIYTKDDPGNWAGKEDAHTPRVEILSASGRENVRVTVILPDASQTHYIEKIFIAEKSGKPWQEKIFINGTGIEEPKESAKINGSVTVIGNGRQWSATFTIPITAANAKEYAVYARCSQHDLWMAQLENAQK